MLWRYMIEITLRRWKKEKYTFYADNESKFKNIICLRPQPHNYLMIKSIVQMQNQQDLPEIQSSPHHDVQTTTRPFQCTMM